MKVWIEQGVIWNLIPQAQEGFRVVCRLFHLCDKDVFVTSGGEGDHLPYSFHYSGRAWDMRLNSISVKDITKELSLIPGYWQVIDHGTWAHIELDEMP